MVYRMAYRTSSNLATPGLRRETRHFSYDAKDLLNTNAPTTANDAEQSIASNPRNALNILKRFRRKDQKYSGGDDECIYEFLDQYDAVSRDLCLCDIEKRQYFHNLFRGEALRFYNANAATSSTNYYQAIYIMKHQLNRAASNSKSKQDYPNVSLKRS